MQHKRAFYVLTLCLGMASLSGCTYNYHYSPEAGQYESDGTLNGLQKPELAEPITQTTKETKTIIYRVH